ncbi:MAG: peptidoglycan recognition protein family protein [Acidobacteriia bacterium]|nr:peptidoglycan recognition protein family protein [Terriglobia bacterium]
MSPILHKSIERKARRIDDPIARLQYLKRRMATASAPAALWNYRKLPAIGLVLLLAIVLSPGYKASSAEQSLPPPRIPHISAPAGASVAKVWLVDKSNDFETYSNGLRIDDRYAISNQSRLFYPVYKRSAVDPDQPEWRSEPAGIVYHTTESDQVPFDQGQNGALKRIGHQVLSYVRQNHCYHFFIDRFGQVFRVVEESDVAFHAGNSIWADDQVVYVNLNSSFLGIAFETQTQRGQDLASANPAQVHAARVLTEMLRSKYNIPAANCVTHAQVSVNPDNMLVGYHTDWAGNFPFLDVGLSDNYGAPPASIYAFGFEYDPVFVHATGVRMWEGLTLAEDQLRIQAAARGLPISKYRSLLRKKYKEVLAAVKAVNEARENDHAT